MLQIILFNVFLFFGSAAHDIHMSKSTIHYNKKAQSVQITTRLFLDDLEDALTLVGYEEDMKLCTPYESEQGEQAVAQYISTHLKITIDGKPYDMDYIGKEISDDYLAAWCYLEIPNITSIQSIKISNTYLHEVFDDQKNIVTVKYDHKNIKDLLLDAEDVAGEVKL